MASMAAPRPLLRMIGIEKSFPGVRALASVDLEIGAGEIHAFIGENGAGKSTLLKILSGALTPDAGTIEFDGRAVAFTAPKDAQTSGIVTIYQEFSLAPDMTVAENVRIGREPSPHALVRDLSVAEQQLVEVARALSIKSRLIVMDEPTSALSRSEVEKLFAIIRRLRADGISTIFVTHRLEEVFEICDRYTVLRDGRHVGSGAVADATMDRFINLMVGRELALLAPRTDSSATGTVALAVQGLSRKRKRSDASAIELHDVSFAVRKGEILGIAGLVGAGRTETARAILGADRIDAGRIFVDGQPLQVTSPRDAIGAGIGLVPEDRKQQALFLELAVRTNLSIAVLDRVTTLRVFISGRKEDALVDEYRRRLNIRMASANQQVGTLSGGNQQKVVLARWLALRPKVLIVDEPTRG